jgi:hypothetical protein
MKAGERDRMRQRVVREGAAAPAGSPLAVPGIRLAAYAAAGLAALLAGWVVLQNLPPVKAPEKRDRPTAAPDAAPGSEASPAPDRMAARTEPPAPAPVAQQEVAAESDLESAPSPVAAAALRPSESRGPRQMQFVTPNGTRVIWTLDPDLDLGPSNVSEQGEIS